MRNKNIKDNKLLNYIKVLFTLIIIFVICFFATSLIFNIQKEEDSKSSEMHVEKYGKQGLPVGVELQQAPDKIDENYIYFSDRILKKFKYNKEANNYTTEAIKGVMNSIPDSISKYVILIPSKITYESSVLEHSDNSLNSINEIYEQLPGNVTKIDTNAVLKNHVGDYIFLRTDSDITSLGAYYISKEFCEKKGLEAVDISTYKEYKFEGFSGVYTLLENSSITDKEFDYVSYYLRDGASNWQTVTARQKDESYKTFETPAIALSRRGMDIFVAGEYSHSILKGDGGNGKTLLLVGDSSAKKLAVWMTPYYDNVYLVGTKRYQGDKEGFQQIFRDYNVTDVILTEEADNFGETVYNQKIKKITP